MTENLTRRDFLKVVSALSLAPLVKTIPIKQSSIRGQVEELPNIIIILFDALSAVNLSLHGYPRKTSPNFERFAQRATVFHNHHSAGNFTTPSTASLFTGLYPWAHRAFSLGGLVSAKVADNNLFRLLRDRYYQAAFSQNLFSDILLYQYGDYLDYHEDLDNFSIAGHTFYNHLFPKDGVSGMLSYDQFLFKREEAHGSLFMSIINDLNTQLSSRISSKKHEIIYPDGLPRLTSTDVNFLSSQLMDGVMELLSNIPQGSFTYIHFMPPHEPYRPSQEFIGIFDDGWEPIEKKKHRLAPRIPKERLLERRQTYDEFIANIDSELGRLMDHLQKTGLLEKSYVIVTSDHGELFERGIHGHSTPLVFEPGIRIPLLISSPGQKSRQDIFALTSNVDLLPTFLHLSNLPIPEWCEGHILPGFGGDDSTERSIFVVEAKQNPSHSPLRKGTVAMIQGQYKLIHYFGYRLYRDKYEFYDLQNDPEELGSQYSSHPAARELQVILDKKLIEVDQPYIR